MSDTQTTSLKDKLYVSESENSQQNGQKEEHKSTSSKLIEREKVEGTMFDIITTEEGTFVALGENRVSDYIQKEEAIEMVKNKEWQLIEQMAILIAKWVTKEMNINE